MQCEKNGDLDNYKLSVIIYANNETDSLKKTISQIVQGVKTAYELIIYLKNETCPAAKILQEIISMHPDWHITGVFQNDEDILESTFKLMHSYCSGTHCIVWTADNEIAVSSLLSIVEISLKKRDALVCAAKFYKNNSIKGYGVARMLVRKATNFLVCILYRKKGKDFFSIYQVFPRNFLNEMRFSAAKNFVYESTLVPLKLNKEYIEIPTDFHKREGGKSNFSYRFYLKVTGMYIYNIFRIWLTPKRKLIQ